MPCLPVVLLVPSGLPLLAISRSHFPSRFAHSLPSLSQSFARLLYIATPLAYVGSLLFLADLPPTSFVVFFFPSTFALILLLHAVSVPYPSFCTLFSFRGTYLCSGSCNFHYPPDFGAPFFLARSLPLPFPGPPEPDHVSTLLSSAFFLNLRLTSCLPFFYWT